MREALIWVQRTKVVLIETQTRGSWFWLQKAWQAVLQETQGCLLHRPPLKGNLEESVRQQLAGLDEESGPLCCLEGLLTELARLPFSQG